jgi:hypothetical protein
MSLHELYKSPSPKLQNGEKERNTQAEICASETGAAQAHKTDAQCQQMNA